MTTVRSESGDRSVFRRIARSVFFSVRYRFRKHILQEANAFDEWFHDRGDDTVGLSYTLRGDSIVFEVGGYDGTWTARVTALYDPHVYAFEPVEAFYSKLEGRFANNPKVKVFHFGLSDRTETKEICLSNDGSSLYRSSGQRETIQLRDICDVFGDLDIARVDLIQINIEGGEFPLLRRMLDTGITDRCVHIKIQFHDVLPDSAEQRQEIRRRLAATHTLLYDYPFVWESWRRKDSPPSA